jgi:hypothetical protein
MSKHASTSASAAQITDPWQWTNNDGPPSHLIIGPAGGIWKRSDIKWDVPLATGLKADAFSRHGADSNTWTGFFVADDEARYDDEGELKPDAAPGRAYGYEVAWYEARDYVNLKIYRRGKMLAATSIPLQRLASETRRLDVKPGASMAWLRSLADPVTGSIMFDYIVQAVDLLDGARTAASEGATADAETLLDAVPSDGPGMGYDDLGEAWGLSPRRAHDKADALLKSKRLREGTREGVRGQMRKVFWRAD